jgi:hypothetical protein
MLKALAILLVAFFALSNVLISPFWLIVVLFGAAIGAIEWRETPRIWLALSTGQYAVPWWDWANG